MYIFFFRLPELGLCATPEKSVPENEVTKDRTSLTDEDISKKPARKRRKI